ncbi:MAG: nucleotide-binding protein [Acidobacteria bacterium]|nr:nucleotide-binding protein [Acidobacteriota bacterium]MBI3489165.1 nucleotide-binding protein [Acidobacteriota bacterium]
MRGALPLTLALTLALAVAVGCQSKKSDAVVAAPTTGAMPATAPGQGLSGKVLERLDASPYCYLHIQTVRGDVWAAVPEAKIEKGTEVTIANPMLMNNFESKTLNRTFPEVYFGTLAPAGGAAAASAPGMAAPAPGMASAAASGAAPMGTPPPSPLEVAKLEKASGADAQTVGEVWAKKGGLKEKTVTIHGKVVKYNPGVMGRNWLHLQDGSGDPAKGTHDIAVTTQDLAAKGDVITIKGVVRVDKDFGSGYTYPVIVEEAKVVKR